MLKRLTLYVVCFYYSVLTPGVKGNADSESEAWEIVTVSILQAFVAAILFHVLDIPRGYIPFNTAEGFLGLLGSVGLIASLWTLIGGFSYPMLHEILEKDQEERRRAEGKAYQVKSAQRSERLKKERDAFFKLKETNPDACRQLVKDSLDLIEQGRRHEIQFELLKNEAFLTEQYINR